MSEPADTPTRKSVSLPAKAWKEIEDYQFENRIKKEAEAIRRLIELGLQAAKDARDKPKP